MKKVKHVDTLLRSYSKVISKEDCKNVLEYVNYMEDINMVVARNDSRTKDIQLNASAGITLNMAAEERGVNPQEVPVMNFRSTEVSKVILSTVNEYMNRYAKELGLMEMMPELHTMDCLIQRSNADTFDAYSRWHSEAGELSNCDRAMAWMLYLNDDFKGGETEFKFQKHREIPETGKLVIWPASYTHTHRGGMIMDGTKYIATGWIHYGGSRSFVK
jgi:hypothetical protein